MHRDSDAQLCLRTHKTHTLVKCVKPHTQPDTNLNHQTKCRDVLTTGMNSQNYSTQTPKQTHESPGRTHAVRQGVGLKFSHTPTFPHPLCLVSLFNTHTYSKVSTLRGDKQQSLSERILLRAKYPPLCLILFVSAYHRQPISPSFPLSITPPEQFGLFPWQLAESHGRWSESATPLVLPKKKKRKNLHSKCGLESLLVCTLLLCVISLCFFLFFPNDLSGHETPPPPPISVCMCLSLCL